MAQEENASVIMICICKLIFQPFHSVLTKHAVRAPGMGIIHGKDAYTLVFRDIAVRGRIFFLHIQQRKKILIIRLHVRLAVIMIAGGHDDFNACVFDCLQFEGKLFHILRSAVVGVVAGQYEGIGRQINDLRDQGVSDLRS